MNVEAEFTGTPRTTITSAKLMALLFEAVEAATDLKRARAARNHQLQAPLDPAAMQACRDDVDAAEDALERAEQALLMAIRA